MFAMQSGNDKTLEAREYSGKLTTEESLPLLLTLSKLYRITPVQDSPFGRSLGLPHVCFLASGREDEADFKDLGSALNQFESEGEWFLTSDFPSLCVLAQPKAQKYTMSLSGALQFRRIIISEIPLLSGWLEKRFNLGDVPALGIDLAPRDLSLPEMHDYSEPHFQNIYLVANPQRFQPHNLRPTSDYDRLLHFGLTEQEAMRLFDNVRDDLSHSYSVVNRFYQPHQDQIVLPSEIELLREECGRLQETKSDPDVVLATTKLLSIASSAIRYGLGIFIESE